MTPASSDPEAKAVAHGGRPALMPGPADTFTPFTGLAKEFNDELEVVETAKLKGKGTRLLLRPKNPEKKPFLPGQPRLNLQKLSQNVDANEDPLLRYFNEEHKTDKLDDLLPYMRYIFVQTPSYQHVMPLHHQKAHARKLVVDENPGLHLLWYYEFIFVKPVPAYFFSRAFWVYIENADAAIYRACLGFMRSYYWLIRYEVDYVEACKEHLIPKKPNGEHPTYEEWCEFIEPFGMVGDQHVNRRFHYGELRLTRINRAAMLFKFSLAYFHIYPQWGSFLAHMLAPVITVFAVCSVVLNSMQVSLAAIEVGSELGRDAPGGAWTQFLEASLWFPVVVMLSIAIIITASLAGMLFMGVKDLVRGNKVRERKKTGNLKDGSRSHGMIW
ncbi:hypothetical protein VTK26DRAFT_7006 [Humicola hyalothermophila]